ncbi:MAG: DUF4010 domain-containing protein [Gemmatimonadota bacterium]|nr:DUF4010 domain-containing protein [Gemmatimonadota bacterium]
MSEVFVQLAVALGLGLLVGMQREWVDQPEAGIRTFAVITVLGALCGQLAEPAGGWVVAAGIAAVAALLFLPRRNAETGRGLTTEFAAVAMFAAGASLVLLDLAVGVVVGGTVAVLLQWKEPLHGFVDRIGEEEMKAIMQLAVIALVVLPILPDRAYGPYEVLNPFEIWLMVVLICGISVAGYMAYKFLGSKAGTLLAGFLGGLISSTATTVSYAQSARRRPDAAGRGAVIITLASTVVFFRVLFEVAVVAPAVLDDVVLPLLALTAVMIAISGGLFAMTRTSELGLSIADDDPLDLRAAITFGLLYAAVLFGVALAREHFGNQGLYIVAGLSGLTDMDAITLSTAKLIDSGQLDVGTGWRMIVVGALSNLVFKAGVVAVAGHRRLLGRVAAAFGLAIAAGIALVLLWPA